MWGSEAAALAPLMVLADAGLWAMLSDPHKVGEATLIAIAAIIIGVIVWRSWPRALQPALFGWLAALGVVAGLAYGGMATAGLALWLFISAAILLAILALVFN